MIDELDSIPLLKQVCGMSLGARYPERGVVFRQGIEIHIEANNEGKE